MGRDRSFDLLEVTGEAGWTPGWFAAKLAGSERGRLEMGWDVARKRDLSVLWVNHDEPATGIKRLRFLVVMRGVQFALQRAIVREAMDVKLPTVGCGDATGMGMDSNETLQTAYGDRWEPVNFGGTRKSELGSVLATTFDDRGQALPPVDGPYKFIATDLYAIHCEQTGGGNDRRLRLVENDNPLLPESHCDIAYAGALALRAGSLEGCEVGAIWL